MLLTFLRLRAVDYRIAGNLLLSHLALDQIKLLYPAVAESGLLGVTNGGIAEVRTG